MVRRINRSAKVRAQDSYKLLKQTFKMIEYADEATML